MPSNARPTSGHPLSAGVRTLNATSDHLVRAYADSRKIYQTDFRALLMMSAAEEDGRMLTAGELATALQLSSGAVTYLVERLAQAGYASREVDSRDRRKVLLHTTADGTEVAAGFTATLDEVLHAVLDGYDADHLQMLVEACGRLNEGFAARSVELDTAARG